MLLLVAVLAALCSQAEGWGAKEKPKAKAPPPPPTFLERMETTAKLLQANALVKYKDLKVKQL